MHIDMGAVVVLFAMSWSAAVIADGPGAGPNSWIGYVFGGNQATGTSSAVAAGSSNLASGQGSFVGSGTANQANGLSSLVIGGFDNRATTVDAMVGAGAGNRATGVRAVVVGGGYNVASGHWSFIGGGGRQNGSGVAGANLEDHVASGNFAFIGGGRGHRVSAQYGTITGGNFNSAGEMATVGGGQGNFANGFSSVIAGGFENSAHGAYSAVLGGYDNVASALNSVAIGGFARADGESCVAISLWAMYPGMPCFGVARTFNVGAQNGMSFDYFSMRADGGGTRFLAFGRFAAQTISTWTGAYLTDGGAWTNSSDVAAKEAFEDIDQAAILERVASLPVRSWRYKADAEGVRRIGPTAQDFRAAFGLGSDEKTIATVDADGVALAAIQALHRQGQEKDARIAALEARIEAQDRAMSELQDSMRTLLSRSATGMQVAQR